MNQVIPEAAVEAASEAFWNDEDGSALESMRLALEAAAPHMRFELQCMSMIDEME